MDVQKIEALARRERSKEISRILGKYGKDVIETLVIVVMCGFFTLATIAVFTAHME